MKYKIGIIQLNSKLDYKVNLETIEGFLKGSREKELFAVFLPECFYSMSDGTKPTPYLVDRGNEHYENIKNLAKNYQVYLLGGSAATFSADHSPKVLNRNYNFDPYGNELSHYDKRNLFSCRLEKDGKVKEINEGDIYAKGHSPTMIEAGDLKVGISICFDLRYPLLYQDYVNKGTNLISISSAFTVPTGKAHWHTLVRARAIETQCFVVAPGQWGRHNDRIQTYGHSLIVDPWGEILADAEEGEKLISAEIDLQKIETVRNSVKVFS